MQIGFGFFGSRTLLSAVELDLFTRLADRQLTAEQIRTELELSARAVPDFTDALVSLGLLKREGDGAAALYSNTADTNTFLNKQSAQYIGGVLEMAAVRLYGFWNDLTEALRTGKPQNEIKYSGEPVFTKLYATPERLEQFMNAMSGISAGNFHAFAQKFDFSKYKTLCDVGGATAQLSCMVAQAHPHMQCQSFDLPQVKPIAEKAIAKAELSDRVTAIAGDFFEDPLPKADVITMGMVLHDWNLEKKKHLIQAAYEALPEGGAFVAIEALIDDSRRYNIFGLLMSLNMLIEFGDAFDYTGADFRGWCEEAGFKHVEIMPLTGPSSAAIAYK